MLTLSAIAEDVRLQCQSCGTRFLNVAPEKLLLGTSLLLSTPAGIAAKTASSHRPDETGTTDPLDPAIPNGVPLHHSHHRHGHSPLTATALMDDRMPALENVPPPMVHPAEEDQGNGGRFNKKGPIASALDPRAGDGTLGSLLGVVGKADVMEAVAAAAGVPYARMLSESKQADLAGLEARLRTAVVGQDEAVEARQFSHLSSVACYCLYEASCYSLDLLCQHNHPGPGPRYPSMAPRSGISHSSFLWGWSEFCVHRSQRGREVNTMSGEKQVAVEWQLGVWAGLNRILHLMQGITLRNSSLCIAPGSGKAHVFLQ